MHDGRPHQTDSPLTPRPRPDPKCILSKGLLSGGLYFWVYLMPTPQVPAQSSPPPRSPPSNFSSRSKRRSLRSLCRWCTLP